MKEGKGSYIYSLLGPFLFYNPTVREFEKKSKKLLYALDKSRCFLNVNIQKDFYYIKENLNLNF